MSNKVGYALTALFVAVGVAAVAFFATHHAVYGNCKQTIEGEVCDLIKWEGNK